MKPNDSQFGKLHSYVSCDFSEPWLERQTSTKLGPYDTIRKVLTFRYLKFLPIFYLDLICMSYMIKRKGKSQIENIDSRSQIT
jgi:hypothetical protein